MITIVDVVCIILISILVILILFAFIVLPNNYLFNAIFNSKEQKLWKFLISNADKFNYISANIIGKAFRWGDYLVIIWFDNTCSIHIYTPTRQEYLGTHIDKVMSNKMRDLLLNKIR